MTVQDSSNYLTQIDLADEAQRVFARSVYGADVTNWHEVSAAYKAEWDAAHPVIEPDTATIE